MVEPNMALIGHARFNREYTLALTESRGVIPPGDTAWAKQVAQTDVGFDSGYLKSNPDTCSGGSAIDPLLGSFYVALAKRQAQEQLDERSAYRGTSVGSSESTLRIRRYVPAPSTTVNGLLSATAGGQQTVGQASSRTSSFRAGGTGGALGITAPSSARGGLGSGGAASPNSTSMLPPALNATFQVSLTSTVALEQEELSAEHRRQRREVESAERKERSLYSGVWHDQWGAMYRDFRNGISGASNDTPPSGVRQPLSARATTPSVAGVPALASRGWQSSVLSSAAASPRPGAGPLGPLPPIARR